MARIGVRRGDITKEARRKKRGVNQEVRKRKKDLKKGFRDIYKL